jgi:hypothetical protein
MAAVFDHVAVVLCNSTNTSYEEFQTCPGNHATRGEGNVAGPEVGIARRG